MKRRPSTRTGPSVGLQITPEAIRAVELKLHGREASIERLWQVETPAGSVHLGRVTDPALVADALRRLWEKGGFSTRRCALAMPASRLTPQMLTLPPAPAAEQRLIVRGELARFSPENEHALFGWMPMASGGGPGGNTLAFVAPDGVIAGYEQALALAGLEMEACEPDATAALRALALGPRPAGAVAAVYAGENCAEMAFLEGGRVRYYRRLDRGHASFERSGAPLWPPIEAGLEELLSVSSPALSTVPRRASSGGEEGSGLLAQEIRRSVQYYERAYAVAAQPQQILLLGDDPALAPLAPLVQETLCLPAECLHALRGFSFAPGHATGAAPGTGGAYDVALGMALRPLADPQTGAALDLMARDPAERLAHHAPRYLMAALSGSTALVLAAMAVSLPLSARVSQARAQLRAVEAEQRADSAGQIAVAARRQQVRTASERLRRQAMPIPQFLTRLGEIVPGTLAITDVQLKADGSVLLEGEARAPLLVNGFLQSLTEDARFRTPNLDTLEADGTQGVTRFRVRTGLAGYGKVTTKESTG